MYQNNGNNSNSVGGNSYCYSYQQQPPVSSIGMEEDRSLQRIIQPPLPQEIIHHDELQQNQQKQQPFLLSQQNDCLHQNMMLFGGGALNGNGNSSSLPMNHPLNGYYYDYSNTAADPRFYQNPHQQQLSHVSQNLHAAQALSLIHI